MQRYFIKLAYNGTDFHGWQRQENAHTVQEEIEDKLYLLFQRKTEVVGCGRTDTGVHASSYYAHFDADITISLSELVYKLNCMLPKSIAIYDILKVRDDAHARFDAQKRSYEYHIVKEKNPFNINQVYEFRQPLDLDLMNKCSAQLLGVDDFKSFCKIGSDNKTTICDVTVAKWEKTSKGYVFYISADRFLRNMVRAIVGTLITVGLGKMSEEEFLEIVAQKDRSMAGSSAPASGLYLTQIDYPKSIFV